LARTELTPPNPEIIHPTSRTNPMAPYVDFIYEQGTLTGYDTTWSARSGIDGTFAPVPPGYYLAPMGALMAGEEGYGVPCDPKYAEPPYAFRDSQGFSWFLWLGVRGLGIHPDGNIPGTEGCIGITDSDTRALFDKLKSLLEVGPVGILVR
jgi:hypothetical protein